LFRQTAGFLIVAGRGLTATSCLKEAWMAHFIMLLAAVQPGTGE
jgi:hypothetical protein